MSMRRLSLAVFLVLCVLCVAHAAHYYPRLPEKMASHFDASGQPDAWSSKTQFFSIYFGIVGFMVLLFLGISFGISRTPVSWINLPNKDYWLSEGHKQKTFDFIRYYFLWFASVTLVFFLIITHQVFQVNLGNTTSLLHPMLDIAIYVGFVVVWIIYLLVKFSRKGGG
jgi:uncharacterized membrane protein